MSLTIKLHKKKLHNFTHTATTRTTTIKSSKNQFLKHTHFVKSKSIQNPVYHSNQLVTEIITRKSTPKMSSIKSSLIEPDGGVLVDLVVPEGERDLKTKEAESMVKVSLTKIDVEWVHVISEGWASPLKGFMRENEYLQSLHFNSYRMGDGSFVNMSLPIVLAMLVF